MKPIIDANEARKLSLENSDFGELMRLIGERIEKECSEGKFSVTVSIELNNIQSLVIAEEIVNALICLDYDVKKINQSDAFSTTIKLIISWNVRDEKESDQA